MKYTAINSRFNFKNTIKIIYSPIFLMFYYFFVLCPNYVYNNKINLISFNQTYQGQINSEEGGYHFFQIQNFNYTELNKQAVQIKVYPYDENSTFVSNPDLFVSQTSDQPTILDNKWHSINTGEDYITILRSELEDSENFYFSVYCDTKCKFRVTAKEDNIILLKENDSLIISLDSNKDFILEHRGNGNPFEFDIYSPEAVRYDVKMFKELLTIHKDYKKNSPKDNIVNIPLYPTFIGGKGVAIEKNSIYLCDNCVYKINVSLKEDVLSESNEESKKEIEKFLIDSKIVATISNIENYTRLSEYIPVFDLVSEDSRRCYQYNIPYSSNLDNENIILTIATFSGSIELDININDYLEMKDRNKSKLTYDINIKNVFKLTPEQLNLKDANSIFFCIYGVKSSSYMIKAIFESHTLLDTSYNFLIDGVYIPAYIPGKQMTKYRIVNFSDTIKGLEIKMIIKSGKPKLYGFFCVNFLSCDLDIKEVSNGKFKNKINPDYYDYSIHSLHIPSDEYKCSDKNDELCGLQAVIYCDGDEECEFDIGFNFDVSYVLLKEK